MRMTLCREINTKKNTRKTRYSILQTGALLQPAVCRFHKSRNMNCNIYQTPYFQSDGLVKLGREEVSLDLNDISSHGKRGDGVRIQLHNNQERTNGGDQNGGGGTSGPYAPKATPSSNSCTNSSSGHTSAIVTISSTPTTSGRVTDLLGQDRTGSPEPSQVKISNL